MFGSQMNNTPHMPHSVGLANIAVRGKKKCAG